MLQSPSPSKAHVLVSACALHRHDSHYNIRPCKMQHVHGHAMAFAIAIAHLMAVGPASLPAYQPARPAGADVAKPPTARDMTVYGHIDSHERSVWPLSNLSHRIASHRSTLRLPLLRLRRPARPCASPVACESTRPRIICIIPPTSTVKPI